MLNSTLLPVEISPALAAYTLTSRDAVTPLMNELRSEQVPLSCFIEGGFISAEAMIDQVLPDDGALVLVAASEVEQDLLAASKAITAVGFTHGAKIQFNSVTKGKRDTPRGNGICVSMPNETLRLQRRRADRVKPSRVAPLECMVRGKANLPTLHRLPVLDISTGGVALLTRSAGQAYEIGQRLLNCSFDLDTDGEFLSDLIVRTVETLDASGRRRYGCAFVDSADDAREALGRYIERLRKERNAAS